MTFAVNPNNPVARQLVPDWLDDQLTGPIHSGPFKPGEWLRQCRVADELGVSEIPVREAFKKLAANGLVRYIVYRGMRACEFSAADFVDIYIINPFVETMATSIAAENIVAEELVKARALATRMELHLSFKDLEEHRGLNRRFHVMIYIASRRTYRIHELKQLWMVFPSILWGIFSVTAMSVCSSKIKLMTSKDTVRPLVRWKR